MKVKVSTSAISSFMIVLIGVSGSGKSTLRKYACNNSDAVKNLLAVTDRLPRDGEVDGVDKVFYTHDEFMKNIESGTLCLINEVYGKLYAFVSSDFLTGSNYLVELHYESFEEFRAFHKQTVNVYVRPFDIAYAKKGIATRGASQDEIAIRNSMLEKEQYDLERLLDEGFFDYEFINYYDDKSLCAFSELIHRIIRKRSDQYGH